MKSLFVSSERRRRWRRVLRWVLLAAGVPVLAACVSRRLEAPRPALDRVFTGVFQQSINRNVDIVFEIDNSQSMEHEQTNLIQNFPAFIDILKRLPGGLPNVHIGVVTSDMGAGAFSAALRNCERPDDGAFVDAPRASTDPKCATARLAAGQHFISSTSNGTQNNFTGDISDVFRCLAEVGTNGCGYESHLEAIRSALGDPTGDPAHGIPPRAVPPNNAGFLRDDAFLAVISITNEGECSVPPNSVLFDPSDAAIAALGPINTRCLAHTDICDGRPVADYIREGRSVGPFRSCVSDAATFAADPTRAAIPVPFYVDYLKRVKADPTKVLLSGIISPATPYGLVAVSQPSGSVEVTEAESCMGAAEVFGQATPRMTELYASFPQQQVITTSICEASFAPAMKLIAERLGRLLGSPCVRGDVLDVDGPNGPRPDCSVVDHTFSDTGARIDTALPACADNGNQAPCWSLAPAGDADCPDGRLMRFTRPPGAPPTELNSSVQCSVAVCPTGGC